MINADEVNRIFWRAVDARIDERAERIILERLRNLRPGGAHPFIVEILSPSASTAIPAAKLNVEYPCWITSVDIYGDPGVSTGTATVDIYVARPGYALSAAASILSSAVSLSSEQVTWPATTGWTTFLESNALGHSVLMPYITAVSGITSLTIAVNVRAEGSY